MVALRTLSASAVSLALASFSSDGFSQTPNTVPDAVLPTISVTATPFNTSEDLQILAPAKILTGNALRDKADASLGATLAHELGVSASSFGTAASRPIIRGMEGPRVKILQNGMALGDVSSLSNDHATPVEATTARQIEILRGPAALLYGSGAIGGLVNVVNDRIPTERINDANGMLELRNSSVDHGKTLTLSAEKGIGGVGGVDNPAHPIALHIDGNWRNTDNYRIPGMAAPNDPNFASGVLPSSFTHSNSLGGGAALIEDWGHVGLSIASMHERYGIPTAEQSFITLAQTRFDIDGLIKQPFAQINAIESFTFKLAHTDYAHTEHSADGAAAVDFNNRASETRWEFNHRPIAGWRGVVGVQTEQSRFSASAADGSGPETIPLTDSTSVAGFWVEQREFGPLSASAGLRLETVKRRPDAAAGLPARDFNLGSYSLGALWNFTPGYALGSTFSIAERAPAIEELYSNGPHESTATFDRGDANLAVETSHNLEVSLQKNQGLLRWKANLFHNRVSNFIYGRTDGVRVDDSGNVDIDAEFLQRFWSQANATIRGVEAEVSMNWNREGLGWRGFADTSRGTLDQAGNLPLQPATRYGAEFGYKRGPWRSGVSILHALQQDRLASFETFTTPAYTQVDAQTAYTQRWNGQSITWFALLKNLTNQDIRVSTSLLKDTAPQAGRNFIVGMRVAF